ncbi:R3H domain-containing protein 4-like isoform X2 [Penaeus japonicus]|uniref:R3H domain-containing protein 4-like isoform X2 n=1 Tax=Penaeus japonicus TaxID=27405 RepID=UPI001C70CF46|nr:R3H domain-containing protein 4-like isoform X2 [Penaeus japonicus]
MGVIRKLHPRAKVISFSEESVNSLGISQPATPPSEPETTDVPPPAFVPQRRDPNLLIQRLEQHHHNQRRRTGARKTRRADNAQALQTLVEDDLEGHLSVMDVAPKSEGVFTKLFNDCDKMRIWQYFISLSEDRQENYLNSICKKRENTGSSGIGGVSFTQRVKKIGQEKTEESPEEEGFTVIPPMSDCRNMHPAYTTEQRFWEVKPQLRKLLKGRQFPVGILKDLEDEIVELFASDPTTVYITQELTSFQRLLVHALCEYNLLSSKSSTMANVRRTKVENKAECFHTPEVSLNQYIETYYRSKY